MAPSADCEGGMGKRSRTPRSLPVAEEANSTLHHGQAPGRSTGPALAHATRRLATASLGGRHRPGGGHRAGGGRAITLRFFGPRSAEVPDRRRGWRQEAVRERLQWFADLFTTEFVRPHPELWFLWGDKRWTRVFRGDSRYTRALTELRTDN
jgi:hypothetical protein